MVLLTLAENKIPLRHLADKFRRDDFFENLLSLLSSKEYKFVLSCALMCLFLRTKTVYFGNSVPKIFSTLEDYKPVSFCVHNCQFPLYTAVTHIYCQLQIIFKLLYVEYMPVYVSLVSWGTLVKT